MIAIIIINILNFVIFHYIFGLDIPLFCLDVFLFAPFIKKFPNTTPIILSFIFSIFIIDGIANLYFFDFVPFVMEAKNISWDILFGSWYLAFALIVYFICCNLLIRKISAPKFIYSYMFASALLIADATQGSSAIFRFDNISRKFGDLDLSTLITNRILLQLSQTTHVVNPNVLPSAKSALARGFDRGADVNIVVLVESLGIQKIHLKNRDYGFSEIIVKYPEFSLVGRGTVKSVGSTVSAELRELCSIEARNVIKLSNYDQCWPLALRKMGLHTIAAHSYRSTFFDRRNYWKAMGFDTRIFLDSPGVSYRRYNLGTLKGADDRDMLAGETYRAIRKSPSFLFFLTSNSHLPIPSGSTMKGMEQKALSDVFSGIRDGIRRAVNGNEKKNMQIRIIIVGDHPPPLIGAARLSYLEGNVPYWVFDTTLK